MTDKERIIELVNRLNQYRHEYYNLAKPSVSDSVYDGLFDELKSLEESTGIVLANSPTQTVGYAPVSKLAKVRHTIPLLSMDKTKQTEDLLAMAKKADSLLMLKLDGLTIKLCYENGELKEASTRGDGEIGEDITHNIPAFLNVPMKIQHKEKLVITGEGIIRKDDFEILSKGEDVGNARNLAAGSIRLLDPSECKNRRIRFYAFNVIEGMAAFGSIADSRGKLLKELSYFGFDVCPYVPLPTYPILSDVEKIIQSLKKSADTAKLTIDGIVLRYDSISYSKSLGRTGHHYKDGIAYKFEDDTYETVFRSIEWETSRSGIISPVAKFDPVEIDGCTVSKASLHNLSFIKDLELHSGCRILVSKRNMIIPHIEENLDRKFDKNLIPNKCPCCGNQVQVFTRFGSNKRVIETLHCDNPDCRNQDVRKFVHFASKKAMNIEGVSKATIEKLIEHGYLKSFADFYHLARYRRGIIEMPGFGTKAYWNIYHAVEKSRKTTFVRYLVAMDIPMVGRTASRALDNYFGSDLQKFANAAASGFDFTVLPDFGETLSNNIREWFGNADNLELWNTLQKELKFERKDETMKNTSKNNPFMGCTIVATGKLENFTRDGINSKIASLGAVAGSSVTKKTSYLICGEKPGSKLAKAKELGVPVLTEKQFLDMISA